MGCGTSSMRHQGSMKDHHKQAIRISAMVSGGIPNTPYFR